MWIGIISLFPEMFHAIMNYGITGQAVRNGLLNINIWNPRDFACDRRRTVDDYPYGGGSGMLMMAQPLQAAISSAKDKLGKDTNVIYLSPQGRKLNYVGIEELLNNNRLILVCGRYKGVDERIIQTMINEEWSIGDYVLSGGELPAMVLIDSVSRFIPGVLNQQTSAIEDSFSEGLLDCPHYTRPRIFEGIKVPSTLLSGDHAKIRCWRLKYSLGQTWVKKPELLKNLDLTKEQENLLEEFKNEYTKHSKTK